MYDLTKFTLRDMTELGSSLRKLGNGARTLEEVAGRVVRHLYQQLADPETRRPSCALLRFFKTHPYAELDEELRHFARVILHGQAITPSTKCLTLLASAGQQPAWNDRRLSVGHKAIPLSSEEMVGKAPMISSLLGQLGVEVEALLNPSAGILVEPSPSTFNVFYIPHARGSPYLPAQEEFVVPCGLESVLGFGGMLPSGNIFVVILFSQLRIPRQTAELFRTLALNVKMAVLPFDTAVFA